MRPTHRADSGLDPPPVLGLKFVTLLLEISSSLGRRGLGVIAMRAHGNRSSSLMILSVYGQAAQALDRHQLGSI